MISWIQRQLQLEKQGKAYVLFTISQVQGSSPRSVGAKLLVDSAASYGSVGGGHLEHKLIKQARDLLVKAADTTQVERLEFALGANLGQCCGGRLEVMMEYQPVRKLPIVVFGAGHVGRALVHMLSLLPVNVILVDGRYDMLPKQVPDGVTVVHEEHPADAIADCPPGSCYLIMTHHHGLDLQLAEQALLRGDAAYVGVIGSATKAARFTQRLTAKGLAQQMAVFQCPMGDERIKGKLPMEIAVSVASKIMQQYQQLAVIDKAQQRSKDSLEPAL